METILFCKEGVPICKFLGPIPVYMGSPHLHIIQPWPTVQPSEKCSFLTLTQFFDAKIQFSGRIDGTI
jgi:hypothetical protein